MFLLLSNLLEMKYGYGLLLIIVPCAAWLRFFYHYKMMKKKELQEKAEVEHLKRHNCVVTYSPLHGCKGYPDASSVLRNSLDNMFVTLEPLLYFVNTAEKSLDVAQMTLSITEVLNAILVKMSEGVKVRLLLDYKFAVENQRVEALVEKGAQILKFHSNESIMHYKFMIKDSKYLVMGSMNLSDRSRFENYDHLVFTSIKSVVSTYEDAFETTWQKILTDKTYL